MIVNNYGGPSSDYPWRSFPESLRYVMCEMQASTKAPIAIHGTSLLSASSLVLQSLYDVRRPNDIGQCPLSIFSSTIAISGERKTTVDKMSLAPFSEFEKREAEKYKSNLISYESKLIAWKIEFKALESQKKQLAKNLLNVVDDDLTMRPADDLCNEKILSHLNNKPIKPRAFRSLYSNTTIEALRDGLNANVRSAGVISDEGGNVLNSMTANDFATYNSLWSDGSLQVDRVGSESYTLNDARLTWSVMIQPAAMDRFLKGRGRGARDVGFLARSLVSFPESTIGTRFIYDFPRDKQHLTQYTIRMNELLEKNLAQMEKGKYERIALEFSHEAKLRWIEAYNNIESYSYPGNYLSDISDYASKAAENIARIAGIFHSFSGFEGEISLLTMNNAIDVFIWYLNEFKRLFSPVSEVPIEQSDAHQIEVWLAGLLQSNSCKWLNGIPYVKKNDVRQFGPNSVRNNSRLNAAFEYLSFCNRARIVKFEKTYFVELNHQYFAELVNYLQIQGRENYQGLPQQNRLPNRR